MAAPNGRPRRKSGGRGRRVFFLASVGLVILSLDFLLGVVAGQRWARSRPLQTSGEPAKKSSAPTRRALSDSDAVKPPQIQEKLTFYQTLTAPLGATPPPPKAETPKPEAKPREEASRERTAPTLTRGYPDGTGTRPVPDAPPPGEARREGTPPLEPGYTVQVSAYRARPAAEEMERKLREAGFEAYVATINGDDGRTAYRVRVGSFATRGEAQRMAERLRSERGLSPFVTAR
ncbi:MAG: SPOR domain-containing protein [Candidatus Rokubacteria bacterium]|nr:SPOR domain-containing protein [Candidatus Rokubacteria bacterium]